jgi:hypothetical protein
MILVCIQSALLDVVPIMDGSQNADIPDWYPDYG